MKITRIASAAAGLSALAIGLVGCGDSAEDTPAPNPGHPGAGGSAGSAVVGNCDPAAAVDASGPVSLTIAGFVYDPPCIRVHAGTKVSFPQSDAHPLKGMVGHGTQPNPIVAAEQPTTTTTLEVTFAAPGTYGYYCKTHGMDAASSAGMAGAVVVVP